MWGAPVRGDFVGLTLRTVRWGGSCCLRRCTQGAGQLSVNSQDVEGGKDEKFLNDVAVEAVDGTGMDFSALEGDMRVCKNEMEPGLYLVSTPIGNLGDITLRALQVLRSAACIFAEDTRRSWILLQAFSIKCPLISCHEHNEKRQSSKVVERILRGQVVAIVTDAGTPCISDPGHKIVQAVIASGLKVIPVPGASAVMTGLVGSGLDASSFQFVGFLPDKQGARKRKVEELAGQGCTVVIYVSPRDLSTILSECASGFGGDRDCCIGKELTKRYEDFDRGTLQELAKKYEDVPVKGEIVLMIGPVDKGNMSQKIDMELASKLLDERLRAGDSVSRASKTVASKMGVGKRKIYQMAMEKEASTNK